MVRDQWGNIIIVKPLELRINRVGIDFNMSLGIKIKEI